MTAASIGEARAAHAHGWSPMQFELVDGHPLVRQRCESCGLVRRYRAWERYWVPATTDRGSTRDQPGTT